MLKKNIIAKFSQALISIRKKFKLTQRQMSEVSKVKQPMLARFEKGINVPKINTAIKLLKPFGLALAIVKQDTQELVCVFSNEEE